MLLKRYLQTLTKHEISRLRGGFSHSYRYFVGISASAQSDVLTDFLDVRLKNQMGSQTSIEYPEGYEPFETIYGLAKLDLNSMTIRVPYLKLLSMGFPNPTSTPQIVREKKAACVLIRDPGTEAFQILEEEADLFNIRHRLRRHAAKSCAKLDTVLSLMAHPGRTPLLTDPAERFELYLYHLSPGVLRDLLALLDMPDAPQGPMAPEFPKAA